MKDTKTNFKEILTTEQYRVAREGATEAPFTGEYWTLFESGTYLCICCGTPLFSSETKYDSGGGWPDFTRAITEGIIKYVEDLIKKHSNLEKELSSGNVDKKLFAEKSKEYSDLNEIIKEINDYISFEKN